MHTSGATRRWAIEDCRQLSHRLEADLLKVGELVVRVPPKMMAGVRRSARTLAAVEVELQTCITDFEPQWLTFDSFQSAGPIQNLTEFARDHGIRTHVDVFAPGRVESRRIAELFKGVLYDGRVHSPMHPLALDELLFLQDLGHRVEAPATGPVDTDDVADCLFAVVARLTELSHDPGRLFSGVGLHATGWPISRADQQVFDRLADPRSNRGQKYQRLRGGKTTREYRRQRRY